MRLRDTYRNVELLPDGRVAGEVKSSLSDSFYGFEARLDLLRIRTACDDPVAAERIWSLQDGYGEAGFTPCQGWDWSGIRDSSAEAIAQMDAVASEFVSDADLTEALGVSVGGR